MLPANRADQAAWDRAHRLKVCRLVESRTVTQIVAGKLQLQWSPEQIACWLKRTYRTIRAIRCQRDDLSLPEEELGKISN